MDFYPPTRSISIMTNKLSREPLRTHLVAIQHGAEVIVHSMEDDECVLMSLGDASAHVNAEECEALANVLLTHAKRLTRRVGV